MSDKSIASPTYVLYDNKEYTNQGRLRLQTNIDGILLSKQQQQHEQQQATEDDQLIEQHDDDDETRLIEWNQIQTIKLHEKMLFIYLLDSGADDDGDDDGTVRLNLYTPDKGIAKGAYEHICAQHARHLKMADAGASSTKESLLSCFHNVVAKFIPRSKDSGDIKQNLNVLANRCQQLKRAGVLSGKELKQIKHDIHKMSEFVDEAINTDQGMGQQQQQHQQQQHQSTSTLSIDGGRADEDRQDGRPLRRYSSVPETNSTTFRRPSQESLLGVGLFQHQILQEVASVGADDGAAAAAVGREEIIESTEEFQVSAGNSPEMKAEQGVNTPDNEEILNELGEMMLETLDQLESAEETAQLTANVGNINTEDDEAKETMNIVAKEDLDNTDDIQQPTVFFSPPMEDLVEDMVEQADLEVPENPSEARKGSSLKSILTSTKLKESLQAQLENVVKKRIEYFEMLRN